MDSLEASAKEEFDKSPVYCLQIGTVAKQPVVKTKESCGELGTELQGNTPMKTPVRKRSGLTEKLASVQKAAKQLASVQKAATLLRTAIRGNRRRVYSRAYSRVRKAVLKRGSTDEEAKRVASEAARNAVKFFLDEGSDATEV